MQHKPTSYDCVWVNAPHVTQRARTRSTPARGRKMKHSPGMQAGVNTAGRRFMQLGAPTSGPDDEFNNIFDANDNDKDHISCTMATMHHRQQTQSSSLLQRSQTPSKSHSKCQHSTTSSRSNSRARRKKKTGGKSESAGQDQSRVQVTMCYYGTPLHLDCERTDPRDDVTVQQQHCGGNAVTVYSGKLVPDDEFSFESQRRPGYPFSATIYVNGTAVCRLSSCCEYRHRANVRLGSKGGYFGLVRVSGGAPCFKCCPKDSKARRKLPSPTYSEEFDSSSDDGSKEEDNMLYIPVDSDEEVKVHSGDSDSSASPDNDDCHKAVVDASSQLPHNDNTD